MSRREGAGAVDRSVVRWAAGIAAVVLGCVGVASADWPLELRVLSGPGTATTVSLRTGQPGSEPQIEDRTPGAQPATAPRGPASVGSTFAGEVALFVRGEPASRSGAIDVADALVSVVKLFPEEGGTTVTIFVRRPVSYTVSRPSALGEIRIELHPRGPAAVARKPSAAGQAEGEREVAVDADSLSYDQQTNTLTARGGVTLTRGETTLTADEVVYDRTNGVAEARGNVVLTDVQGVVEGDFAHLDLDDETGWLEQADGVLRASRYHLQASRFEKQGGPKYRIADGVFTTCECGGLERPSWSIACRDTNVKLQGAGVSRHVFFRVKDVPVLYFPALVFPVNTERQSGFLMPRVGYSNRRGFQYEQPFYWAINKSVDATLALDVETQARIGGLGEVRYALSPAARGNFTGAYFNEAIRGRTRGTVEAGGEEADIPENRWALAGHHVQPLPRKSRFYLDLFVVGDKLFLREINTFAFGGLQDLALRSARFTTSRTGVYKGWERGLAQIEGTFQQDLVDQPDFDPDLLTLQRLPRMEAEHTVPLLGDRVLGRVAAEGVNFWRRDGFAGLRGDIFPELMVPFRLGRALSGSVSGLVRETAYHLDDREQVAYVVPLTGTATAFQRTAPELPRLDADRTRELAEVNARTSTEFARIFPFRHFGLERLKHTIEPEVRYLYVPQVGRPMDETFIPCRRDAAGNLLPGETRRPGDTCDVVLFSEGYLFDEVDAINRRNFFSYGVTSRLIGRVAVPGAVAAPEDTEGADEEAGDDDEEPDDDGEAASVTRMGGPLFTPADPIDEENIPADFLAPGLPADAIPQPVGPPAPTKGTKTPAVPTVATRELARASVLQGYDVSRALVGSSHLSDVDLGLRVTPVDWLGMSYSTTIGTTDAELRGLTSGLFMREPTWKPPAGLASLQSPSTVAVSYRYIAKDRDTGQGAAESLLLRSTQGLNEVDGSLYLRLGNYVGFTFIARYDLSSSILPTGEPIGPHFLERDYLVRLISRCNCWMVEAGVADKFNPDERVFRIQFTLVGLGSYGKAPGVRNYAGFASIPGLSSRRSGPAASGGY